MIPMIHDGNSLDGMGHSLPETARCHVVFRKAQALMKPANIDENRSRPAQHASVGNLRINSRVSLQALLARYAKSQQFRLFGDIDLVHGLS